MIKEEDFNFSHFELEMLFCLQYRFLKEESEVKNELSVCSMFRSDKVKRTKELELKLLKKQWLREWVEQTKKLLSIKHEYNAAQIKNYLHSSNVSEGKLLAFIVEVSTFQPYFPFSNNEKKYKDLIFSDYAYLKSAQDFFPAYGNKIVSCKKLYSDARQEMAKEIAGSSNALLWVSVAAASSLFLAPFLGAAIGGLMGLSGAAATSAGLAFLGGGAIAAGGFGMAGGTVAVMAGGSLVAYASNNYLYQDMVKQQDENALLVSCAKLAALIGLMENRKETVKYLCDSARVIQNDFEDAIDDFFIDPGKNKEFSVEITEKKIKILRSFRKFVRTKGGSS